MTAAFVGPEVFGALGAADAGAAGAADAGAAAGAGAAGAAGDAALTAGALPTADALLTAGPTAAGTIADVATPLTAGSSALTGLSSAAISGLPDAVSGLSDLTAGALPAATQAAGTALPTSDITLGPAASGLGTDLNMLTATTSPATAAGADASALPGAAGGQVGVTPDLGDVGFGSGGGTGAIGDFSSDSGGIGSDIWNYIKQNPGLALAIPSLGASILRGNGAIPGSGPVNSTAAAAQGMSTTAQQNAGQLMSQANQNLGAPTTGALPPGTMDAINSAANAAKTQIRSSFAAMGIPAGSTMEAQQLAEVDQGVAAQRMKASLDLANLGVSEAGQATSQGNLALGELGLTNNDMLALMNAQIQRDQQLQQALARFAGAAAGPSIATAFRPTTTDTAAA